MKQILLQGGENICPRETNSYSENYVADKQVNHLDIWANINQEKQHMHQNYVLSYTVKTASQWLNSQII